MFGSQNISKIHLQDPISNTIFSAGSGLLDHILGPLGFTLGRVVFPKHSTEGWRLAIYDRFISQQEYSIMDHNSKREERQSTLKSMWRTHSDYSIVVVCMLIRQ
jgi:hypothetical protein